MTKFREEPENSENIGDVKALFQPPGDGVKMSREFRVERVISSYENGKSQGFSDWAERLYTTLPMVLKTDRDMNYWRVKEKSVAGWGLQPVPQVTFCVN